MAKKERPVRVRAAGPGRGAKVGEVRLESRPDGRKVRHEVAEVRRLPGGVVVVIEHGREVI